MTETDPVAHVTALISQGNVAGAIAIAEQFSKQGRLREALHLFWVIGEGTQDQRGWCAGRMSELHAQLGEFAEAESRLEMARQFGAPLDWVNERHPSELLGLMQNTLMIRFTFTQCAIPR